MNGDCNRGRILLVVPHANVTVAIITLPETPPLVSSVLQEAHLAEICFLGNAFHHQTHRVLAEWLTRAPSAAAFVHLALGKPSVNCERQLSLKKKQANSWYQAGKFLIPIFCKRANSWYQLLIGHWERSNCRKATAKLRFEEQAGMHLNFRAMAGGALIGQNHRNRHMTCGKCGYSAGGAGTTPACFVHTVDYIAM